jgi:acylphosphatase
MTEHINLFIYGDVQGVFFRRTIKHEASRRGIKGFIQNKPDGSVYLELEGAKDETASFVEWIEAGADGHTVKRIDREAGAFKAFDAFEIKE